MPLSASTPSGPFSSFLPSPSSVPDIHALATLLSSSSAPRSITILCGAGISTSAGIPDFRSPSTGLYANLARYNLPYAEAIFDIDYFRRKPEPFYALAKELYPGNFKPTITHTWFELLRRKGMLRRVWTQNIDTLERLAGLPDELIVEAHGSFATSRCLRCKREVDADVMRDLVFKGEVVRCQHQSCRKRGHDGKGELVKPDIVFFGEGLPDRFFKLMGDMRQTDLVIVLGTSLQVHPFASLPSRIPSHVPRVLINLERVGEIGDFSGGGGGGGMGSSLFAEEGFDFDGLAVREKRDTRDVFLQGKTDDVVREVCRLAGWEDELLELHKEVHARIDGVEPESQPQPSSKTRTEAGKQVPASVPSKPAADTSSGPSDGDASLDPAAKEAREVAARVEQAVGGMKEEQAVGGTKEQAAGGTKAGDEADELISGIKKLGLDKDEGEGKDSGEGKEGAKGPAL